MDKILTKIYWLIKGYKRFGILSSKGIWAEFIIGNNIYVNWRNFGKRSESLYDFRFDKYKNIVLINKETSEKINSTIFFSEKYHNCSHLLETNNFLLYFLKKNIDTSTEFKLIL